jgi:hypothetical protein
MLDKLYEELKNTNEANGKPMTYREWAAMKKEQTGEFPYGRLAEDGYAHYLETELGRKITREELKKFGEIDLLTSDRIVRKTDDHCSERW